MEFQIRQEILDGIDVTIKYKARSRNLPQIIDMACPRNQYMNEKVKEKLQKYQQMAYKIRELRPGYHVGIIPVVIGCMRGVNRLREQIARVLETDEKMMTRS